MADSIPAHGKFAQVMEAWGLTELWQMKELLAKVCIRIIEHRPEKTEEILLRDWVQDLIAEGVSVDIIQWPCTLHKLKLGPGKATTLNTPEVEKFFSPEMWEKVLEEPQAGAICISHTRAITESLNQYPKAQMLIVIESDVEASRNIHHLMANAITNFLCNPEMEECEYLSLSFSNWHDWHDRKVRNGTEQVKGSLFQPYANVRTLPMDRNKRGKWRYQFVGQGSRAIAYRRSFAEWVVKQIITHFHDMYILETLSQWRMELWDNHWKDVKNLACVTDPPVFHHEPDMGERFRGSGRLQTNACNSSEEISRYICVDFSNHEWGFCNRAQTIAVVFGMASLHRFGVYILWPISKACTNELEEVIEINYEAEVMKRVPFVKTFSTATKDWHHATRNSTWCMGTFNFQVQVDHGIEYFFKALGDSLHQTKKRHLTDDVIETLKSELTSSKCWETIKVPAELQEAANKYMMEEKETGLMQAAIHIRRGDYAKYVWGFENKYGTPLTKGQVSYPDCLEEADAEVMEICLTCLSLNNC